MEQHCEVQQQLLQHACNLEYGTGYMNMDDETSPSSSNNDTNTITENTTYVLSSFFFYLKHNISKILQTQETYLPYT